MRPQPVNWERVGGQPGRKDGIFEHSSGWQVQHCGHPTANWPYFVTAPAGHEMAGYCITSFNGLGFVSIVAARTAVELVAAGRVEVTRRRCVGNAARIMLTAAAAPAEEWGAR